MTNEEVRIVKHHIRNALRRVSTGLNTELSEEKDGRPLMGLEGSLRQALTTIAQMEDVDEGVVHEPLP